MVRKPAQAPTFILYLLWDALFQLLLARIQALSRAEELFVAMPKRGMSFVFRK
jgi:hypothetical protein